MQDHSVKLQALQELPHTPTSEVPFHSVTRRLMQARRGGWDIEKCLLRLESCNTVEGRQ